jgi:ACS family hexuronate transporter-like MFS transporter
VWLAVWLRVYHPLDRHPRVTPAETALIQAGQDTPRNSAQRGVRRYLDLAENRNVWGIVLGRALTDPIWWFYVF